MPSIVSPTKKTSLIASKYSATSTGDVSISNDILGVAPHQEDKGLKEDNLHTNILQFSYINDLEKPTFSMDESSTVNASLVSLPPSQGSNNGGGYSVSSLLATKSTTKDMYSNESPSNETTTSSSQPTKEWILDPPTLPNSSSTLETTTTTSSSSPITYPFYALRSGVWSPAECKYTIALIKAFLNGVLPIPPETTLRGYLATQLHCDGMRVSKKISTGKIGGIKIEKKLGKSTFYRRDSSKGGAIMNKENQEKAMQHLYILRHLFWKELNRECPSYIDFHTVKLPEQWNRVKVKTSSPAISSNVQSYYRTSATRRTSVESMGTTTKPSTEPKQQERSYDFPQCMRRLYSLQPMTHALGIPLSYCVQNAFNYNPPLLNPRFLQTPTIDIDTSLSEDKQPEKSPETKSDKLGETEKGTTEEGEETTATTTNETTTTEMPTTTTTTECMVDGYIQTVTTTPPPVTVAEESTVTEETTIEVPNRKRKAKGEKKKPMKRNHRDEKENIPKKTRGRFAKDALTDASLLLQLSYKKKA